MGSEADVCPSIYDPDQIDSDGDFIGDACDHDSRDNHKVLLQNLDTQYCVGIENRSTAVGAELVSVACNPSDSSQQINFDPSNTQAGHYQLLMEHSGMCLDAREGGQLKQYPCNDSVRQQFLFERDADWPMQVEHVYVDAVTVTGREFGADIIVASDSGDDIQRWRLIVADSDGDGVNDVVDDTPLGEPH